MAFFDLSLKVQKVVVFLHDVTEIVFCDLTVVVDLFGLEIFDRVDDEEFH